MRVVVAVDEQDQPVAHRANALGEAVTSLATRVPSPAGSRSDSSGNRSGMKRRFRMPLARRRDPERWALTKPATTPTSDRRDDLRHRAFVADHRDAQRER